MLSLDPIADERAAIVAEGALWAEEALRGAGVVDDRELRRLALASQSKPRAGWRGWLMRSAEVSAPIAYLGVTAATIGHDSAELALLRREDADRTGDAIDLAVAALDGGHPTQLWVRSPSTFEDVRLRSAGAAPLRALDILGRTLAEPIADTAAPDGVSFRSATASDRDEIVRVIAAAFEGMPDTPFSVKAFEERAEQEWFDLDDILLAEVGDDLVAVHWMRRRSETVGEVHIIGVAPAGGGRGIGRPLLHAGFAHLRDVGCTEVILWADQTNERAIQLYKRSGMTVLRTDRAYTVG